MNTHLNQGLTSKEKLKALLQKKQQATSLVDSANFKVDTKKNYSPPSRIPLSYTQKKFFLSSQISEDDTSNHLPLALKLVGKDLYNRLEAILTQIVEKNEILRTTFHYDSGEYYQLVHEKIDLSLSLVTQGYFDLNSELKTFIKPFHLDLTSPFRASFFSISDHEAYLLLDFHHIIADAYSFSLLMQQIVQGLDHNVIDKPKFQYQHFIPTQQNIIHSSFAQEATSYWSSLLKNTSPQINFYDKIIDKNTEHSKVNVHSFSLDQEFKEKLKAVATSQKASLYMLLLTCFASLLYKKSTNSDFLIGTSLLGRSLEGADKAIGPFINNVPVFCSVDNLSSFDSLFNQIRERCLKAFKFENYPFFHFEENQQKADYNVFFELHHKTIEKIASKDCSIEILDFHPESPQFDLILEIFDTNEGLVFEFKYSPLLLNKKIIQEYSKTIQELLHQLLNNFSFPLHDSNGIKHLIYKGKEHSEILKPLLSQNICDVILENSKKYPYKVAVIDNDIQITYQKLASLIDKAALNFERIELLPERPIILLMERGLDFLIAMLASFKTGIPYIPLDTNHPPERLKSIIAEAHPQALIYDRKNSKKGLLLSEDIKSFNIQELRLNPKKDKLEYLFSSSQHIAYIIFTSGSTGKPKGVMVTHQGMMNHLAVKVDEFNVTKSDCVAQTSIQTFDVSVWQFLVALVVGGTVSVFKEDDAWDPVHLLQKIDSNRVTIFETVPSHMKIILDYLEARQNKFTLPSLKCLVLNGEILTPDICNRSLHLFPDLWIVNAYGPTECSDDTCHKHITNETVLSGVSVPIGNVISNTTAYLLNKDLTPVAHREQGELYFEGICLARGYYSQPKLTALAFLPSHNGTRMYKTGDYARAVSDTEFEYISRVDNEVKIRGQRISPHEIEAEIKKNAIIKDCLVNPFKNKLAEWALACYYLSNTNQSAREIEKKIIHYLRERLPDAMIPRYFIHLAAFPLLPNGKINTKELPSPQSKSKRASSIQEELNSTERLVIEIWQELLSLESIGIDDNFFDIGGHSLLAIQAINIISKKLQITIPLRVLFSKPTARLFSDQIEQLSSTDEAEITSDLPQIIPDQNLRYSPFPATDVQQAYLFGRKNLYDLGNVSVHVYSEYEKANLSLENLEKSWNILIQRHDALRTIFPDLSTQLILQHVNFYKIEVEDLTSATDLDLNSRLTEIRSSLSHEVFDASKWPLFRLKIVKLKDKYRLYLSFDALLIDGWSSDLIFNEWFSVYNNLEHKLEPLKLSVRDYTLTLLELKNSLRYKKDKSFWQSKLPHFPLAPTLPLLQKPQEIETPTFARHTNKLPAKKWKFLKSQLKQYGFSPTGLIASLFGEILAKFSGNRHFAINLTLFDRLPLHPQVKEIAGDFTSLFLLEIDLRQANKSLFERIQGVHDHLWSALEHKLYNGISFIRDLAKYHQAPISYPVVLTSVIGIEDDQDQMIESFLGKEVYSITQTPQVWLDYKAYEVNGDLVIEWDFVKDLFPDGFVQEMHELYCDLLLKISENFDLSKQLTSISIPNKQQSIRELYNATYSPTEAENMYSAFARASKKYCSNIAIQTSTLEITYEELSTYSLYIAQHLSAKINKKQVAILLPKGWEQVASVLGVLASSNAYIPIDSDLPKERILAILKNSDASAIITNPYFLDKLVEFPDSKIFLFKDLSTKPKFFKNLLELQANPDDLAYIIYTSGSTGVPKGVMIQHKAAMNTIKDLNARVNIKEYDSTLALSKLSFDLSVYDIFGPLTSGGSIVIPDQDKQKSPVHWIDLIENHNVTLWNSVPMYMQMLIEHLDLLNKASLPNLSLTKILLSGDWISIGLPKRIFSYFKPCYLYSLGGATEASIWSIYHQITADKKYITSIPYGRPLLNQTCYILDEVGEDLPDWTIGELHIGGIGLALGYANDSEKTNKSFISHRKYGRLYKTGDLARHLPSQEIEIIGRKDAQIKIKGHRIEIGEILSTLRGHPDICDAIVVPEKEGAEIKSLVNYFIPNIPAVDTEVGVIMDPSARFKLKLNNSIWKESQTDSCVLCEKAFEIDEKKQLFFKRKSYRNFSSKLLSKENLLTWLSRPKYQLDKKNLSLMQKLEILSCIKQENSPLPKYYYPSAGNTYSVSIFISVNAQNEAQIKPGTYRYNPFSHSLELVKNLNLPSNTEGLSVFFASDLNKVSPLYGKYSEPFVYLEYGYIMSTLEAIGLFRDSRAKILSAHQIDTGLSIPVSLSDKFSGIETDEITKQIEIIFYIKSGLFTDLSEGWYRYSNNSLDLLDNKVPFSLSLAADMNYFILHNCSAFCFFLTKHQPRAEHYIEVGKISQNLASITDKDPILGSCAIGMLDKRGDGILSSNFPDLKFLQAIALGPIELTDLISQKESKVSQENFGPILKQYLSNYLPNYMVPSQYIHLDKFPLSPNGKIDHKALPKPDKGSLKKTTPPSNKHESALLKIWQEILNLEDQIGISDDFFELGGNSLSAIQIYHRILEVYPNSIQIDHLFKHTTISSLANFIKNMPTQTLSTKKIEDQVKLQKQRIRQKNKKIRGN